ncbi:MAG: N-ethylmaleimide reductase [Granulosicoccus sp.]|jgi:N-ethylmaleimide reductase
MLIGPKHQFVPNIFFNLSPLFRVYMNFETLFSKAKLGDLQLPHRIVMAPLTRSRSIQPGDVPQDINVEYYNRRASAALIISEATQISLQGKGYAFTPGIHSDDQIKGWKKVTDAVHAQGSRMFLQLWHVGRISHSKLQVDGQKPVAPSAIAAKGQAFTEEGMFDFETPRALLIDEIPGIVEQYRQAASNAKQAGFDGVEVHAANGYLLDQFLKESSNVREDKYGGTIENRVRLTLEVVAGVCEIWGGDRVGIRISRTGRVHSIPESQPQPVFNYLVEHLDPFNLAYLHVVKKIGDAADDDFNFSTLRQLFSGAYMANGGYTCESAEQSLLNSNSDFVAFGTAFIANPDLPQRIRHGAPLTSPDRDGFYGGLSKGYIDYPAMA